MRACLILCLLPLVAHAEGSGGTGGPAGEQLGWPCASCRIDAPNSASSRPTPLLVALHGDEGTSEYIYDAYRPHARDAGWLLVSLECPRDQGCWSGSWYEWEDGPGHDWGWLGEQVDAVEAAYDVDRDAVYLTGWSGGAQYLGRYAVRFDERYAGVAYIGGGLPGWNATCPGCAIPAYFLIGSRDFLLDSAEEMQAFLEGCAHEVRWDERPGRPHADIWDMVYDGGGTQIIDWFGARPNVCRTPPMDHPEANVGEPWVRHADAAPPEPEGKLDGGLPDGASEPTDPAPPSSSGDAGAEVDPEDDTVRDFAHPIVPRPTEGDETGGCATTGSVAPLLWMLLLATRRSRRRWRRPRGHRAPRSPCAPRSSPGRWG